MKVLLNKNVSKLGMIGEVVDVKSGYARNYLLPQRLAVLPTAGNLKAIEESKQAYLEQLAKEHAELKAKAAVVDGKEVTITARANAEGHLYGSVGPAQVSAALTEINIFIDAEYISLDEPIRQLDKYDVKIVFSEEVTASITVWIVPSNADEIEAQQAEEADVDAGDQDE